MVTYTTTVPAGVAGTVSDEKNTVVETGVLDTTTPPTQFGVPVKLTASGDVSAIEAGDTADVFYGIIVRCNPDKTADANFNGFGAGSPDPEQIASIAVGGPGYVTVLCSVGTPVKGGAVYMRVVEALPKMIGDLEADSDGGNSVVVPELVWDANGKDSDDVARVRISTD